MSLVQPALFEIEDPAVGPDHLGQTKVSEIYVKQLLTKPTGSLKDFDYTLNPYIGCGFACSYCYAAFFQPDEEKFKTWGSWVEIKKNAEQLLLKKRGLRGSFMMMSSATDPYQPLESKVRLTRRLVEIMSDPLRQPQLLVQTRSPLVARDIDLFQRFAHLRVNMSITTDSDAIRREFEPSCASIDRRFEALEEVGKSGLRIGVSICPLLPLEDPERFAKRLAALNADCYWTGFFHDTDRPFAANTRATAWAVAKRLGWNETEYRKSVEALARYLPTINGRSKSMFRRRAA